MEVVVLGVGDLANPSMTNTSFLVRGLSHGGIGNLLIDCGYNIFEDLVKYHAEDLEDLKVFITHFHSDHIGSLGQLIYYRYFKYGNQTVISTSPDQLENLNRFLEITVSDLFYHNSSRFRVFDRKCYSTNCNFMTFETDHFGKAFGVHLPDYHVAFTGDTDILNEKSYTFRYSEVIFHDCTMITDLPKGIHASISDIQNHYSDETKKKLILVHHGLNQKPKEHSNLRFALPGEKVDFRLR